MNEEGTYYEHSSKVLIDVLWIPCFIHLSFKYSNSKITMMNSMMTRRVEDELDWFWQFSDGFSVNEELEDDVDLFMDDVQSWRKEEG
jgi:hypothetical protein